MKFNLEAEVKRATAAYLSLEGIAIPESIRKPVSGPCVHCGEDTEDWCKWNQCWLHDDCADKLTREQEADHRADDPRHNQSDYLNRS